MSDKKNNSSIKLKTPFRHILQEYADIIPPEYKEYFESHSDEFIKDPREYIKKIIINNIGKIGESVKYEPFNPDDDQGRRNNPRSNIDDKYIGGNLLFYKNIPILAIVTFIRYNGSALIGTTFDKVLKKFYDIVELSTQYKMMNEYKTACGDNWDLDFDMVECIELVHWMKTNIFWDESSCSHIDSFLPFFPFKKIDDLAFIIE